MNYLGSLEEITHFRSKFTSANLIIDTNVLLLLLVGSYDEDYLRSCGLMTNNGKNYGKEEFKILLKIIDRFLNKITLTPQILSEIWSLSEKHILPAKFNNYFTQVIQKFKSCEENYIPHKIILANQGLLEFGFTDISLIEAARGNKAIILTDEDRLYIKYNETVPIIKFSNVIAKDYYKVVI